MKQYFSKLNEGGQSLRAVKGNDEEWLSDADFKRKLTD